VAAVARAALAALAVALAGCAARGPVLAPQLPAQAPAAVELAGVPFFPQEDYQCGPAALATVLAHSGAPATPAALAPQVYLPERKGSLQIELVAAARRHGRIPVVVAPRLSALVDELQAGRPVLVMQNLALASFPVWHYAVAVGYDRDADEVLLRSGRTERLAMPAAEFARTWTLGERWGLVVLEPGRLPAAADPQAYLDAVAAMEPIADPAFLAKAYRAALVRWPEHFVARFGLASALRRAGELADAERLYRALHAARPAEPAVANNLADLLVAKGCPAEALALVERALAAAALSPSLRGVLEQTRDEARAAAAQSTRACTLAADPAHASSSAGARAAAR